MSQEENKWEDVDWGEQSYHVDPPQSSQEEKQDMVLLFGNQHPELKDKYSVLYIEPSLIQETVRVMNYLNSELLNITCRTYDEFIVSFEEERKSGLLNEISFIKAAELIRATPLKKEKPLVEYEFSERDEFDENCVAECTAGDHKCGK